LSAAFHKKQIAKKQGRRLQRPFGLACATRSRTAGADQLQHARPSAAEAGIALSHVWSCSDRRRAGILLTVPSALIAGSNDVRRQGEVG